MRTIGIFSSFDEFLTSYFLNPAAFHIISRSISALCGILSIYFVYLLSKKIYSKNIALLSSLIFSLTYLHARDSHFGTTDVPLTFLIILSYLFITDILLSGKNYICAGILSGLSASIKYNGAILALPILIANLIYRKNSEGKITRKIFDRNIFFSAGSMALSFIITSPYIILDYKPFLKNLRFITKSVKQGIGMEFGIGWLFYLKLTLRYGIGLPLLLTSLIGILYLFYRHKKEDIFFLSFPLVYYLLIGNSYGVFSRYMIPIFPFLCIFSGIVIYKAISSIKVFKNYDLQVSLFVSILIMAPSIYNLVTFNRIIAMEDTRNIAVSWIKKNIATGSKIYIHGSQEYEVPPLPKSLESIKEEMEFLNKSKWNNSEMTLRLRTANSLLKNGVLPLNPNFYVLRGSNLYEYSLDKYLINLSPDYIITTEYYLDYYSSDASGLNIFLKRSCVHIKSFYPYDSVGEKPKPVFDPLDAFYVPYAKPDGIIRPGPVIHIYKVQKELIHKAAFK